MERMFSLPGFPLTEKYEPHASTFETGRAQADLTLMFCAGCSHASLANPLQPEMLYGADYRTRTSKSSGATRSVQNFARFIRGYLAGALVVDIGGNDGSLISQFGGGGICIDPHAQGPDDLKCPIEAADVSYLKKKPKLITSSHTLEHIINPVGFFAKVREMWRKGDMLAIQLPSLDLMVDGARFDQVHHQHVHYYSAKSLTSLLFKEGFEVANYRHDHDHYGTLMVTCFKVGKPSYAKQCRAVSRVELDSAHNHFLGQMQSFNWAVERANDPIGLGASLMLPALAYYAPALSRLEYIADNDKSKDGLRYVNFNVPIRSDYHLWDRDVVITALNTKMATRALTALAFEKGARNAIVPLHTL